MPQAGAVGVVGVAVAAQMMAQAGAMGVVGMAVAAQMFLKVQTIAANKCY